MEPTGGAEGRERSNLRSSLRLSLGAGICGRVRARWRGWCGGWKHAELSVSNLDWKEASLLNPYLPPSPATERLGR
jgi:hypothetical protein